MALAAEASHCWALSSAEAHSSALSRSHAAATRLNVTEREAIPTQPLIAAFHR